MVTKKYNELSDIFDNHVNINTRELFLCGTHGSIEPLMAIEFIKGLKLLEGINFKPITIHQYSIGGDISSGMMIYDAIRSSKCTFTFICYGAACSMGSIIPQAVFGKGIRISTENCEWLIHEGDVSIENSFRKVKSAIDASEFFRKKMIDIYTNVCQESGSLFKGQTKKQVRQYITNQISKKDDWIFYGLEALDLGFVDQILVNEGI